MKQFLTMICGLLLGAVAFILVFVVMVLPAWIVRQDDTPTKEQQEACVRAVRVSENREAKPGHYLREYGCRNCGHTWNRQIPKGQRPEWNGSCPNCETDDGVGPMQLKGWKPR